MKVNEIFKSIQGESTFQGLPCVFVRLSGCNLRCSYCDTKYAYEDGYEISVDEIVRKIGEYNCELIEITGGEPLLQEEVYELSNRLVDKGYRVLIDTNGSISIEKLAPEIIRIVDIKCPGSGMSSQMYWDNIEKFRPTDEIKFVLSDKTDYEWAKGVIKDYLLLNRVTILFSPSFGKLSPSSLAEWILADNLNVRLQLQLHKYIGVK